MALEPGSEFSKPDLVPGEAPLGEQVTQGPGSRRQAAHRTGGKMRGARGAQAVPPADGAPPCLQTLSSPPLNAAQSLKGLLTILLALRLQWSPQHVTQ